MKRTIVGPVALALAWIAVPTTAFAAASITNGSFEAGTYVRPANWNTFFAGSTSVTGWTIDSGSIDATFSNYWQASDGEVSIDLNGDGPGAISQAISTTVGAEYTVTFDLSANPDCGTAPKSLTVMATGGTVQPETFDVGATGSSRIDMKWSQREYTFVATAATTTLTFASTTGNSCGPALDDIAIAETLPPPPPPVSTPTTTADCKNGGWSTLADADGHPFRNQGDCVSYVASKGRNTAAMSERHAAPDHQPGAAPRSTASGANEKSTTEHGRSDRHADRQPNAHARAAASTAKTHGKH